MHGAGNDFILVDDRDTRFPASDGDWIAAIARRKTGVGCDGIILLQPSDSCHVRMRFINPDGQEVDMCGNGARCLARLAVELGAAPAQMTIETAAGPVRADVRAADVQVALPDPHDWQLDHQLDIEDQQLTYSSINTTVPHVVIRVPDLTACRVEDFGRHVRWHEAFAPDGANVNFIAPLGDGALAVRTYERGVEAETLACGTGCAAVACLGVLHGLVDPPVRVRTRGGAVLTVGLELEADRIRNLTLAGPAAHVYRGTLSYGGAA